MVIVNTESFFYLESFLLISSISEFLFRAHLKAQNLQKILLLQFFEVRFFPNIFVVSLSLVQCLLTSMIIFVISVVSGVSSKSRESSWPSWTMVSFNVTMLY